MTNRKFTYYLLWLILAVLPLSTLKAQKIYFPHYTTKQGLPSNNCFFSIQDKKGYLWIATDAGVSRFDGTVFENFTVNNGLPDNQILQLREDSKGRIWFLSLNGQLSYFYNGKIYNQDNNSQLKELNFNTVIVSFFEDSKGRIWFGTNTNLIGLWDGKSLSRLSALSQYNKFQNAFIYEDKNGNIWAYNENSTFLYTRGNFLLVGDHIFPQSYKTVQYHNHHTFLVDNTGLNLKEGPNNTLLFTVPKELTTSKLGYIFYDGNELWLSNNHGAYKVNQQGNTEHFLDNEDVNQILKDKTGNVWFITKNGIYKMPNKNEQLFILDKEHGLTENNLKSIYKDNRNRLWLGTGNAQINILNLDNKKIENFSIPEKDKFNAIKQLNLNKQENKMYFASDYGLGSINVNYPASKNISYLREKENLFFVVKNFTFNEFNNLSIALSSGVFTLNDNNLSFSTQKSDFQKSLKGRAYRVFYDHNNNLWFSNINGLNEVRNKSVYPHYQNHPLLKKRINDIQQLPDQTLVLATDGYGILYYKNNKILNQITTVNGLSNNIVNRLFVKNNAIWAISNTGINRITLHNNVPGITSFDYLNEVLSDDLNDLYIDTDTAYFATKNGLLYFAYKQSIQNNPAPQVYISSVSKNHQDLDLGIPNSILQPDEQNITINYSAIDFKNRNIIYRYRLKADATWIETKSRRLDLTSLEPGSYVFEVCAKSQDSEWSKASAFSFTLKKYFYQTWWFICIIIVLAACLLYLIASDITKRKKNKEQEQLLLRNKVLMLEQKALQAMMNPHFVFNVMNSIQHYINTKNTSSANKVLTGFAKLIRKNLEICTKSYINLEEEIEYLNLYLSLEKYRFGNKFNYHIIINDEIDKDETYIPSMLLQPFIENAIWHGIMPKEEGGTVTIEIGLLEKESDCLLIKIIDDGIGIENSLKNKQKSHQSKGMSLTLERINLLNKIEAKSIRFKVQQNGNWGTTVTINIPMN
ncbi:two-component regulator propeller domain-containing protein [Pedobacter sp.]|uniref:sensor histidine kinase n=1 Tax=Pedobacter sp. TaxID=1411316 RepID=UPI00396CEAB7